MAKTSPHTKFESNQSHIVHIQQTSFQEPINFELRAPHKGYTYKKLYINFWPFTWWICESKREKINTLSFQGLNLKLKCLQTATNKLITQNNFKSSYSHTFLCFIWIIWLIFLLTAFKECLKFSNLKVKFNEIT